MAKKSLYNKNESQTAVKEETNIDTSAIVNGDNIEETSDAIAVPEGGFGAALMNPEMSNDIALEAPAFMNAPYVQFAHPQSTAAWSRMIKAKDDLEEGDPFLMYPAPQIPVILQPLEFYMMAASQFFFHEDKKQKGKLIEVALSRTGDCVAECIEAVILVVHKDQLIPATCSFKTAKCPAIHTLNAELKIAKERIEEWGKKSAEHKQTTIIPDYRLRAYASIRMVNAVNKQTGQEYVRADSYVKPTTSVIFDMIKKFYPDDDFKKKIDAVGEKYARRLSELKSKIL